MPTSNNKIVNTWKEFPVVDDSIKFLECKKIVISGTIVAIEKLEPDLERDESNMTYIRERGKRHYINHFCSMVQSIGEIGQAIQCNNHVFNTSSPEDMAKKLAILKEAITCFEQKYKEQFREIPEALEH